MSKKIVSDELNKEQSVVVQEQAGLPATEAPVDLAAWGLEDMSAKDIMIPKIFIMQAMSKQVTAGDAKFGEFRDSLNNNILSDGKTPIEFVPFLRERCYVIMREEKGQYKFKTTVPITPANEDWDFEAVDEDGARLKRYRTQSFYALLVKDIKEGSAIPHMISFRSSSSKAGQKLTTTMYVKNIAAKKSPAAMVMELSANKQTNEKGTFMVLDVKEKRPSTTEEVAECFSWVKTIMGGKVKVDHSDLENEAGGERTVKATVEPEGGNY